MPHTARYILPQHATLQGPHSREDLYLLVERGSLPRGEIVYDQQTRRAHKVGDLIHGMAPVSANRSRTRPAYRELEGDAPWANRTHTSSPKPRRIPAKEESERFEEEEILDDEDSEEDVEDDEMLDDEDEPEEQEEPELYYQGHPSWLSYGRWLMLSVILVAAGIFSIEYFSLLGVAVGSGLGALILCVCILARMHQDYLITADRVELIWGLLGRSSKEVRITDIRSIDVHEKGTLGMLGIGTVEFSSSGTDGVEVRFKNVRKPHRVKEIVRQLQQRQ